MNETKPADLTTKEIEALLLAIDGDADEANPRDLKSAKRKLEGALSQF